MGQGQVNFGGVCGVCQDLLENIGQHWHVQAKFEIVRGFLFFWRAIQGGHDDKK